MRRRRAALAAATVVITFAGAGAGITVLQRSAGPSPAPIGPAPPANEAPPAAVHRIVIGALSRDEPVRLVLPGLVRDRREPERIRLWAGGDSTAVYVGGALASLVRANNGVVAGETYRTSSGLSRPDFFDWPATVRGEVAVANPNVVMLMMGANDPQGLVTPEGRTVAPLTEAWQAEYRRRVEAILAEARGADRLLVWVGQPVMNQSGFNGQLRVLNAIVADVIAAREDAIYIDAYALTADPDGAYRESADTPSGPLLLRASDGIHFTGQGGAFIARAALDAILTTREFATE